MSLINDALKRAHESQGQSPADAPPLPPATGRSHGGSGWILPLAIILLLAAGGLFLWVALDHRSSKAVSPHVASVAVPQSQPTNPAPASAPALAVVPQSNAAATTPAPGTNNVIGFLPERWPKVQGIIFIEPNPTAIVDGKIVNVGDQLGRYLVKAITKNDVTFQRDDGSLKQMGIGE